MLLGERSCVSRYVILAPTLMTMSNCPFGDMNCRFRYDHVRDGLAGG